MDVGHFYFLSDKYFIDFPDKYLMQNHEEKVDLHRYFCFFARFLYRKSGGQSGS